MKYIIVGTAGHVDHGKTELTKRLTGIYTDRLKEEQERGISIKLGFAPLELPNGQRVGLVDVPGHEKFIKQMLAGAAGMDLVLLVIAADEGIMPQTKEHLDILKLLMVEKLIVVLSKKDLVDEEWLALVEDDVKEYLQNTPYADSKVVEVSSLTGEGIEELKKVMMEEIAKVSDKNIIGKPRIPIDRVFTITGFGTVVTGTLWSGTIKKGDNLVIMPKGIKTKVRNIQVHGENKEEAFAGQRVALNLTDVEVKEIEAGSLLIPQGLLVPSYRVDMEFMLLEDKKELEHRTRVRVHAGTNEVMGRIYLLDRETLKPGEKAFVQLQLEEELVTSKGDRLVIRSYSPMDTIGGGIVIDGEPKKHKRFDPEVIEEMATKLSGSPEELILQYLAGMEVSTLKEIAKVINTGEGETLGYLQNLVETGKAVKLSQDGQEWYLSTDTYEFKEKEALYILGDWHKEYPLQKGISKELLRSRVFSSWAPKAYNGFLDKLLANNKVKIDKSFVSLADFSVMLSDKDEKILKDLENLYIKNKFTPPTPEEAFQELSIQRGEEYLSYLIETDKLIKINEQLIFTKDAYEEAKQKVQDFIMKNGNLKLSDARDFLNSSRKFILPLLEHFDQIKFTRRVGDERSLFKR